MTRRGIRPAVATLGIATLLAAQIAEAQWVMLARRAVGRIEQMSQSQGDGGASYDAAAVMIEAPADKVYAAVVRGVSKREGIKITSEDAATRTIQFTNGTQIAGIKVSMLGDDLSHLLVSSAHTGSQPNAAAMVSESIMRVCKEMNVECSRAAQ
jgi:hypothetical protein